MLSEKMSFIALHVFGRLVALLLDDFSAIRKIDKSDMLSVMQKTPDRLVLPADAESTCRINIDPPRTIVFAGLGGSAIVGDILADYCRDIVHVPVTVCRSVKIPEFVDKSTFFVAISYSGDTRETLGLCEQAKRRNANLAAVTSGGKLLSMARTEGIPYLEVNASMPPRVALPELVAALLHVLEEAGVLDTNGRLLESASTSTRALIDSVKITVPLTQNPAKQTAFSLHGHLPLLVGTEENVSVLRRFKNELNENSKEPAFFYSVPETFHNDIEGLKALNSLSKPQPIILRDVNQEESEQLEMKKLLETFSRFGYALPCFFSGIGDERFGWLFSAITFGDFVSFYLAMLNDVDPSELTLIPHFKALKGQV